MKTKIQIIEETVAYYSEDTSRRSVNGTRCMYNGPDGKHCAFARCAKPIENHEEGRSAYSLINIYGANIMLPEYQIDDAEFWLNIQRLHDKAEYWDSKGITKRGKEYADFLRKNYGNEQPSM